METATSSRIEEVIHELFFHRSDVAVHQYYSATTGKSGYAKICQHQPPWVRGRCEHRKADTKCGQCPTFVPLPITPQTVKLHLDGVVTLGAYQIGQDGTTVRWGCLDFDDKGLCSEQDLQDAALITRESLAKFGIPSYFEASGGNGWRCHVWVLFAGPVAAIKVKALLDAALKQAELHEKPFIERFPKQAHALNGYGNLVKVPLGIHRKTRRRSQFLDEELRAIGDPFAALERVKPLDPAAFDFVLDMNGINLEDAPLVGSIAPATNFNCSPELLDRILSHCWYYRELERQQRSPEHSVFYEDWWNYVLLCSRFGDTGINRLLEMSQQDERYDFEYAIRLTNYIRLHGYHAPSCKRLRGGPGQIRCSLDPLHCGAPNAGGGTVQGVPFSDFEQREARRPQRLVVAI